MMKKNILAVLVLTIVYSNSFAQNNPFPAVPTNNGINYQGSNQMESNTPAVRVQTTPNNVQVQVPNGTNVNVNQIPNPAQAQAQAGIPMQAPTGLPIDSSAMPKAKLDGQAEAALTILNADPNRIRQINQELYKKGRVINEGPVIKPRSTNTIVSANIAPNSTPPVVRTAKNTTTTIVITDMSGQPWPVLNYDGLSEEDFVVKRLDSPQGFIFSITPKGSFVQGNLVIIPEGLNSSLSIDFIPAQKEVDVKTEIRIQAKGPKTQIMSSGLPSGIDTNLLSVLQGVTPEGSKMLKTSSNAVQAWSASDGNMYVRTRYKVRSPAPINITSSPDGTFAYKMVPVPVVLYLSEDNRDGEFLIDGFN